MNIAINQYQNKTNDAALVKQLYEQFAKKLLAYTRKRYGLSEDDAWTLVYKTIYRIAEVQGKYTFENQQKFSAFVFKTHINYLRNYYRDNRSFEAKHQEVNLDEKIFASNEDLQESQSVQLKVLQQHLDRLEDWERILLLMRGQGLSYSEIANFVNKPQNQLKVYYARLKKQLMLDVNETLLKLNRPKNGQK